jgi:site-specific recombinase XerD
MDAGSLAPLVAEFGHKLKALGHTHLTVMGYDASARHFGQWLTQNGIEIAEIDEAVIKRFACHRCHCPGNRQSKPMSKKYVRRVRRFVAFLARRGIIQRQTAKAADTPDQRVLEFQEWLRRHRGICAKTIDRHGRMIMRLLPALGNDPGNWDAPLVRETIIAETKRASHAHVKTMTQALRGYLRFLSAQGLCRAGLEHAVPTIPQWRLSSLPRYIGTADVERLIATCDFDTPTDIRNRAILLLLARLGLRAGDVSALRFDDIDWQYATVSVRGKGRRETRLPLPQDAGDAVLRYLNHGRPHIACDALFLTLNAPFRPLCGSAVSAIVCRALDKAGIAAPTKGANLLRHSAATAMLRGGATLDAVGAVLRHRSPDTTAHYAKVDVTMLQQIAQPWPGGASC